MSSEILFEEDYSEDVINELDNEKAEGIELEDKEINEGLIELDEQNELLQKIATNERIALYNKNISQPKLFQLPLARVRNLMKLDPDMHIASNEAVFCVTRATEMFIESLSREAFFYTVQSKKKTIQKRDVDMAAAATDSLMFLDGSMNF